MANRRVLDSSQIENFLAENDEISLSECESECQDNLLEDDVQSDTEDEFIDEAVDTPDVSAEDHSDSISDQAAPSDGRIIIPSQRTLRGKNKHCWATRKGQSHCRTSAINIVRAARGPTRMCRNISEPLLCFNLFITDAILSEIMRWTNEEISLKCRNKEARDREAGKQVQFSATFRETHEIEIRALIGILALSAAMKDNHLSTEELFDSSFSGTRYVAVMSRDRFDFLIRCLRMDDKSLRPTVRTIDPFIPVRKVWYMFIHQCIINYTPGPYLTIDEKLLGFRGRCPFRMYILNKPNKYGIKIPMMCDSGTKYMINGMPYIGKATNTNGVPQGEFYIKELSKSVHGTNRYITCVNWFTSVPLAKSLLKEPYKLTLVGTIRSNKKEIPDQMKNTRSRAVGTSMYCYDGPLTLKRTVRQNIQDLMPNANANSGQDQQEQPPVKKKRYCAYCPSKLRRMSKLTCVKCKKPVCGEHNNFVCHECI